MSAESLSDLLANQLPAGLAVRARTLLKVQAAVDRALPASLVGHVRVMLLENGVLSLACDSGASASRLRHQTEALLDALGRHGVAAASVKTRVSPDLSARYEPPVEKRGVPAPALDGLAHLRADLEDGPLKDALGRLLRHHRGD